MRLGHEAGLWLDYGRGASQSEMPVVLADSGPINSQPESPGGLDVPNQDAAVLSDMVPDYANLQVERLLPSPEAPPPRPGSEHLVRPGFPAATRLARNPPGRPVSRTGLCPGRSRTRRCLRIPPRPPGLRKRTGLPSRVGDPTTAPGPLRSVSSVRFFLV